MSRISIVLITYNRCTDIEKTLGVLESMAEGVHEIVVVNNASTDATPDVLREFAVRIPNLRVVDAPANLGVAGGRNLGIANATGDILFFLDDDAEILVPDFAERLSRKFASDPALGALAVKVVAPDGTVRKNEFPHWKKTLPADKPFEVSYFIGAGHAIRASALRELDTEPYPEVFFYSQEELFLSYDLLSRGYRIEYFPDVTVLHWQSGAGRGAVNYRKWHLLLRNTLLVNRVFLPSPYYGLSFLVWSLKTLRICKRPGIIFSALADFRRLKEEPQFRRRPFSKDTFDRVRRNGGRVLW